MIRNLIAEKRVGRFYVEFLVGDTSIKGDCSNLDDLLSCLITRYLPNIINRDQILWVSGDLKRMTYRRLGIPIRSNFRFVAFGSF